MMMYDPTVFGTPLPMLQIPTPAIQSIQSKLATAGCLITRYTQDCCDLPTELAAHVRSVMVDVGYICRKCHMVFPHRAACVNHQQLFCYQGSSNGGGDGKTGTIIKLEQIQYRCQTCDNGDREEKFSTVAQVQAHIEEEKHQRKQQTADKTAASRAHTSPSQTPGDPAPKAQTPPPHHPSSSSSPPTSSSSA